MLCLGASAGHLGRIAMDKDGVKGKLRERPDLVGVPQFNRGRGVFTTPMCSDRTSQLGKVASVSGTMRLLLPTQTPLREGGFPRKRALGDVWGVLASQ